MVLIAEIPSPSLPLSPPSPVLSPAPPPSPIRSLGYRAAMIRMRADIASTSHSLPLPPPFILSPTRLDAPSLGIPPPLPISVLTSSPPLLLPSGSRREDRPEVTLPPRKRLGIALGPGYEVEESLFAAAAARPAGGLRARLLLTAPRPGCEVGESSAAAAGPTMACRIDCSSVDTVETRKDRAAVRAEIEVLRRERLAYEQESMENRQALARSEAYSRALEARITVLETQARRHEWQRQDADDRATRHIMRIQALEAGARDDTLEDTASRRYRSFVLISYPKMAPKRATRSTPVTTTPAPTATTTTSVTNAQLQAMIDQGVTAALAARDANRNGDDSHTSGTGGRRTERVVRECTYQDFMKCKPLYFKGTEGVVELTQWFKR
ncbi:hypothetical protein Tco_0026452 [Tanacetum coccineum]